MEALRGSGISLLYQDPYTMLNPLLRCGDHITEGLAAGGVRRGQRSWLRDEAVRRLAEVGIANPDVARSYPFQLSGGMRQRVAIAAALARDPDVLIADEPSTALDVTTQAQILALLRSVQQARGMGLILITHDLRVAFSVCARVYVLYAGTVVESAPAADLEREPLHPYSLGLLVSDPPVDRTLARLPVIEGGVEESSTMSLVGDPHLRRAAAGPPRSAPPHGRRLRTSDRNAVRRASAWTRSGTSCSRRATACWRRRRPRPSRRRTRCPTRY